MRKSIVVFSLISWLCGISQNMVHNSSFEKTYRCALDFDEFNEGVFYWSSPTNGTPDLFNNCSFDNVGVPINFHGRQASIDGGNYAGCYFLAPKSYREYIQGKLKSTLKEQKKYKISFYINLSDNSVNSIKNIGILLSDKKISLPQENEIKIEEIDQTIQASIYNIDTNDFYNDKNEWTLITKEIVAKGNENYITIGNFLNNEQTEKEKLTNQKFYMAYYYIDNVKISQLEEGKKVNSIKTKNIVKDLNIKLGKIHRFENVIFEFNSSVLDTESKKEIDLVYNFLIKEPNTKITITGHTDNVGSNEFNVKLSENRIKSVVNYLLSKGLNKKRVTFKGYGASKPISSNTTEEGKRKNRRVEFKITRK